MADALWRKVLAELHWDKADELTKKAKKVVSNYTKERKPFKVIDILACSGGLEWVITIERKNREEVQIEFPPNRYGGILTDKIRWTTEQRVKTYLRLGFKVSEGFVDEFLTC